MLRAEAVISGDIPQPLFLMLSNRQITNPRLPDVSKLIRPSNVPEDIWRISTKSSYIESYPHPPYLSTSYCSGNFEKGNPKNHLVIVEATAWKWKSAEETVYGYGVWQVDDDLCVPISDWMEPQLLPKTYKFGTNHVKVRNISSHSICPSCHEGVS